MLEEFKAWTHFLLASRDELDPVTFQELDRLRKAMFTDLYYRVENTLRFFNEYSFGFSMAEMMGRTGKVNLGTNAEKIVGAYGTREFREYMRGFYVRGAGGEVGAVGEEGSTGDLCITLFDYQAADVASDGTWIVTTDGLPGHHARVWSAAGGEWDFVELNGANMKESDRAILAVDIYRGMIVTATNDGRVYLWERGTGKFTIKRRFDIPVHTKQHTRKHLPIWAVKFSRDGTMITAGSGEGTIATWNVSGELVFTTSLIHEAIRGNPLLTGQDILVIAWGPDGCVVPKPRGDCILIGGSGEIIQTFTGCAELIISIGIGDGYLACGTAEGSVFVWDLGTGGLIRKYQWEYAPVYAVTWHRGWIVCTQRNRIIAISPGSVEKIFPLANAHPSQLISLPDIGILAF